MGEYGLATFFVLEKFLFLQSLDFPHDLTSLYGCQYFTSDVMQYEQISRNDYVRVSFTSRKKKKTKDWLH
jgi:hypothetical protein